MNRPEANCPEHRPVEGLEMIRLMREGVVAALREHRRRGQPVVVWDGSNDQVVEVKPEEIIVPEVGSGENEENSSIHHR